MTVQGRQTARSSEQHLTVKKKCVTQKTDLWATTTYVAPRARAKTHHDFQGNTQGNGGGCAGAMALLPLLLLSCRMARDKSNQMLAAVPRGRRPWGYAASREYIYTSKHFAEPPTKNRSQRSREGAPEHEQRTLLRSNSSAERGGAQRLPEDAGVSRNTDLYWISQLGAYPELLRHADLDSTNQHRAGDRFCAKKRYLVYIIS